MKLVNQLLPTAALLSGLFAVVAAGPQEDAATAKDPITVRTEITEDGDRFLIEEVTIEAPVADVWRAYTTGEGFAAWAATAAEVDLAIGGTIRTHYTPGAKIGDPGTNTLHIVNFVPERLLTLRADVAVNWPKIMKEDADRLSNVIVFESLDAKRTRIHSYGIGYRDTPEYNELLTFFEQANRGLYERLIEHLEG